MVFIMLPGEVAQLVQAGRAADALLLAQQRFAEHPNDGNVRNDLAVLNANQGSLAAALELLLGTTRIDPNFPVAHYNLAAIYKRANRFDDAAAALERAVALKPDWGQAHYELGVLYAYHIISMDASVRAEQHLKIALSYDPNNAQIYVVLAASYHARSLESQGELAARKALELEPNHPEAHLRLGQFLIELDRGAEAIPHLEKAEPHYPIVRRDLERLKGTKKAGKLARYPRSAAEFNDLETVIEKYLLPEHENAQPIISRSTKTFSMGSCFAVNLSNKLKSLGVDADHVNYPEELNNTFANRFFLEWLRDGAVNAQTTRLHEFYGEDYRAGVKARIAASKVLIYSLGVAPCFFDRESGEFVLTLGENIQASLLMKQFDFKTTSVQQNVDNLRAIIELIREFNPDGYIVLTVSPVPLKATFERKSAITADCISKSTLRVACDEVMRLGLERIIYWPSFEIVRWIGGHTGPVFGEDDGSPFHPNDSLIRTVVATFLAVYGDMETARAAKAAFGSPSEVATPYAGTLAALD